MCKKGILIEMLLLLISDICEQKEKQEHELLYEYSAQEAQTIGLIQP